MPPMPIRKNLVILYSGVALILLVVTLVAVLGIRYQRQMAESNAGTTTDNLAQSLEQSIDGMIDKIDITLLAAGHEIGRQMATGRPDAGSINRYLLQMQESLPEVAYIRATDERGRVIYGKGVVSPPVNQSDRDFFTRPRDTPGLGLYVEKPLFARINQT